jgi:hypothetical protein
VDVSPVVILFGLGVFVVLLLGYLASQHRQRRVAEFAAFAATTGLAFSPDDPFGIRDWAFALFHEGDGQGVENVLHGEWRGMPVRAFDFWYYERSSNGNGGTSKSYSRFTCAVTPIEAACAHLIIDEEHLLTRIADAVVSSDISFESEAFNRAFQVRCGDRSFATAFVDARMMDWMLAHAGQQGYEILGDKLMVVRRTIDPSHLPELLDAVCGFAATVPRVVFSLYPRSG